MESLVNTPSSFTATVGPNKTFQISGFNGDVCLLLHKWQKRGNVYKLSVLQTAERGTVQPKANFDAGDDAAALEKAIEGLGTNTHTHT